MEEGHCLLGPKPGERSWPVPSLSLFIFFSSSSTWSPLPHLPPLLLPCTVEEAHPWHFYFVCAMLVVLSLSLSLLFSFSLPSCVFRRTKMVHGRSSSADFAADPTRRIDLYSFIFQPVSLAGPIAFIRHASSFRSPSQVASWFFFAVFAVFYTRDCIVRSFKRTRRNGISVFFGV